MAKHFHNRAAGFTLLEVLIVVAITGVLLSIGIVSLPRDRFAVQQAAQRAARDVQLARFEAIRRGTYVGIHPLQVYWQRLGGINAGNGYLIFLDNNPRNYKYDVGEEILTQVDFSQESVAQLYRAIAYGSSHFDVVFDPRGISRGNSRLLLANQDLSYQQWVCINVQGNTRIKSALASC